MMVRISNPQTLGSLNKPDGGHLPYRTTIFMVGSIRLQDGKIVFNKKAAMSSTKRKEKIAFVTVGIGLAYSVVRSPKGGRDKVPEQDILHLECRGITVQRKTHSE